MAADHIFASLALSSCHTIQRGPSQATPSSHASLCSTAGITPSRLLASRLSTLSDGTHQHLLCAGQLHRTNLATTSSSFTLEGHWFSFEQAAPLPPRFISPHPLVQPAAGSTVSSDTLSAMCSVCARLWHFPHRPHRVPPQNIDC